MKWPPVSLSQRRSGEWRLWPDGIDWNSDEMIAVKLEGHRMWWRPVVPADRHGLHVVEKQPG